MQGTHPNTKSTVKFASWLWITTFKRSHLLRIWAPRHTQEAWGWHLMLIVGHGSLPSTHSMLHVISCLQYFIHNLCLSLHAFLSLHTMFRLHLLLGIPSPSYCLKLIPFSRLSWYLTTIRKPSWVLEWNYWHLFAAFFAPLHASYLYLALAFSTMSNTYSKEQN